MDKFKVNDRVKFVNRAARERDPKYYPPVGTTGTIVRCDGDGLPKVRWDDKHDHRRVEFPNDKYLELVPDSSKVLIMIDKHDPMKVVARDLSSNKTGEARCNPEDTFDFFIGAALALGRLFGYEPEISGFGLEKPKQEEPKPTFKVGDLVRMKQDCVFADTGWGEDTIRKGVCRVSSVSHDGRVITLEGLSYSYSPDWLEPVFCKFKVGDKIIGNAEANRYGITKEGWIGVVTEILSEPEAGGGCDKGRMTTFVAKGKDGAPYWLSDDAFDLYEEPEGETVAHCNLEENARLISMIMDFDAEGKVFDWYEQHIRQLSDWYEQQLRARSEVPHEEPKYYNGKLVCVYSGVRWWKVGRVYPVTGGVVRDDEGDKRTEIDSIDTLHQKVAGYARFVELKE